VIVISLAICFSSPALSVTEAPTAATPITSFSLTPSIGGYLFSSTDALKPTPIYGLRLSYDHIGRDITDTIGFEATVNYFTTTAKSGGGKANGTIAGANAIFSFTPRNKWVPFFTFGGGEIFLEQDSQSKNNSFVDYSVGVKYFLENYLAVRVEARQLFVYEHIDTRNNFSLSTGLTYYFGKERIKKSPPLAPKKPQQDLPKAIPDLGDIDVLTPVAPDLLTLEKIGAAGAGIPAITAPPVQFQPTPPPEPLKAPALAFKQLMRSGTLGETIQSPAAPPAAAPPAAVPPSAVPSAAGRPASKTAGKAVAPRQAQPAARTTAAPRSAQPAAALPQPVAPGSLPPAAAPAAKPAPLPRGKMLKLLTVRFASGRSAVSPKYEKGLAAMAATINASPEATVRVEGHTDSTGGVQLNLALSQARAQSVKEQLVKFGVDPKKVFIKGYGFSRPQATNSTPEGRQINRRAVIIDTTVVIIQ
jgi:OmpA-OmpF porin, OOP family